MPSLSENPPDPPPPLSTAARTTHTEGHGPGSFSAVTPSRCRVVTIVPAALRRTEIRAIDRRDHLVTAKRGVPWPAACALAVVLAVLAPIPAAGAPERRRRPGDGCHSRAGGPDGDGPSARGGQDRDRLGEGTARAVRRERLSALSGRRSGSTSCGVSCATPRRTGSNPRTTISPRSSAWRRPSPPRARRHGQGRH